MRDSSRPAYGLDLRYTSRYFAARKHAKMSYGWAAWYSPLARISAIGFRMVRCER